MECRSDRTHLDLFSGIGGFALAARWAGLETTAFCEKDPYCQRVLKKNFPDVPIHDDVKTFDATQLCRPWLLTGGYPCQPFSQAGQRRGKEDDRHLWPEMLRVIRECRPTWICAENVAGHISMGLDTVLADLESEDYSTRTFVIPACAKDAPHRKDRIWIVAYSNSTRWEKREGKTTSPVLRSQQHGGEECRGRWLPEPSVGRVAHGIPKRVDRLRGIGNGIVPQVAYEIIRSISEAEGAATGIS